MRNYPFRARIYTKQQIDEMITGIESELPDMTEYYTKSETDTLLGNKQNTLTAGDNIAISDNVISATDTKYTAGTGISISEQNVISSDGASYTAGNGISIDNNVISNIGKGYTLLQSNDLSNYIDENFIPKTNIIIILAGEKSGSNFRVFFRFDFKKGINISEQSANGRKLAFGNYGSDIEEIKCGSAYISTSTLSVSSSYTSYRNMVLSESNGIISITNAFKYGNNSSGSFTTDNVLTTSSSGTKFNIYVGGE